MVLVLGGRGWEGWGRVRQYVLKADSQKTDGRTDRQTHLLNLELSVLHPVIVQYQSRVDWVGRSAIDLEQTAACPVIGGPHDVEPLET